MANFQNDGIPENNFQSRGGVGASAINFRVGDWNCIGCSAHNFASRKSCFKCDLYKDGCPPGGYPPPGGGGSYGEGYQTGYGGGKGQHNVRREGDWDCGACSAHNFASRGVCFKCHAQKPGGVQGYEQQGGFQQGGYGGGYPLGGGFKNQRNNHRPGDWGCPECAAHNFASKMACFKCGIPKPENMPVDTGFAPPQQNGGYQQGSGYSGGGRKQQIMWREGDWDCGACSAHNFASRGVCFKCHAPKNLTVEDLGVTDASGDGDLGVVQDSFPPVSGGAGMEGEPALPSGLGGFGGYSPS